MSAVAHFFVAVSGSFIHERMAQLFIDSYIRAINQKSDAHISLLFEFLEWRQTHTES